MTFKARIINIEKIENQILELASALMVSGTNVYSIDLFILGALNRILSVSSGFRKLMDDRNLLCSAALLRMQIDTSARVNALRFVENSDELCRSVIDGGRFDKHKDSTGNKLRDGYLISKLNKQYGWVAEVYRETSGFVHLSERHIYASMSKLNDETRSIVLSVGASDVDRPDSDYFELLDAFIEANRMACEIFISYIRFRKNKQ